MTPEQYDDLGTVSTGDLKIADGKTVPRHMLADAPEDDDPRNLAGDLITSEGWWE